MNEIIFRSMETSEIEQIRTIDRTETIYESYAYKEGTLQLFPDFFQVDGWDEEELDELIRCQYKILEEGGKVIGAFDQEILAAAVSIEKKKRGAQAEYCKMDMLYVSSAYRGKRIGQQLIKEAKTTAKAFGAKKLYISATPTKATVDFYLKAGAILCQETDPELFELEPLDIHLEIEF